MLVGPVIEFVDYHPPRLISAGHDGLFPYKTYPFDEIYVIANRPSYQDIRDHTVDFWLPYGEYREVRNLISRPWIKVHRRGVLWHDRTREIQQARSGNCWLSSQGFTDEDPRKVEFKEAPPFAYLPGLKEEDWNIRELLQSKAWRIARDFHTRNRPWIKELETVKKVGVQQVVARRFERDKRLVGRLKEERGAGCQICGFTFIKHDGLDYCEVHHLECLADGGLDASSNMIVLCANCHRKFHYGNVQVVRHTATNIVVSMEGVEYSCLVGDNPKQTGLF